MKIDEKLFGEFLQYYTIKNFAKDTIRGYELEFRRFLKWFNEEGYTEVEHITLPLINKYRFLLSIQPTNNHSIYYGKAERLAERTVQTKIQPIKKFLEYVNKCYGIGMNYTYIEVPRCYSKHMDYFEKNEVKQIMKAIEQSPENPIEKARAKLLVVLGFNSGMRIGEMVQLTVEDIKRRSSIILGKGKKERQVFFNEEIEKAMNEYLILRNTYPLPSSGKIGENHNETNWLFISHHPATFGNPISIQTLCYHIKKYNQRIKIQGKKFSTHTMRHSSATYMLDKGANIREVQEYLGHSDIKTTQGYTHMRNNQVRDIHKKIFGK